MHIGYFVEEIASYQVQAVLHVPLEDPTMQSATRWNMHDMRVPVLATAAMMTTAINAAIRPYSMAVAPSSSCQNANAICFIVLMIFSIVVLKTSAPFRTLLLRRFR
jgi:hypothetical protein